jgi:GGDEF domain-containing protein
VSDSATRLLDAVRHLNQSLDPSQVLLRVCEEAARLLDADNATVFLGSADEGMRAEATYGRPAERIGDQLTEGAATVPLRWDGRLRAVLAVGFEPERPLSVNELELLEAFGELAAAACRNATAHAGLALAARTDALTGCLNHSAMHDALGREMERCRRKGHALSLVILDLDEFKQVNELHGHLAGDEVLRHVGESLRQSVRAYDLVARYGGDEFAVIAIDADEATAMEVARRADRPRGPCAAPRQAPGQPRQRGEGIVAVRGRVGRLQLRTPLTASRARRASRVRRPPADARTRPRAPSVRRARRAGSWQEPPPHPGRPPARAC